MNTKTVTVYFLFQKKFYGIEVYESNQDFARNLLKMNQEVKVLDKRPRGGYIHATSQMIMDIAFTVIWSLRTELEGLYGSAQELRWITKELRKLLRLTTKAKR